MRIPVRRPVKYPLIFLLVLLGSVRANSYPLCSSSNYTPYGGNECDAGSFCGDCYAGGVKRCNTMGSYDYVQGQYTTRCVCRCWSSMGEWSSCNDECTYQEAVAGGSYRLCMAACDTDDINDVSLKRPKLPEWLASTKGT